MIATASGCLPEEHLLRRLGDAVIRENLRACQRQECLRATKELPFAPPFDDALGAAWLRIELAEEDALWLPVEEARLLQPWKVRATPFVRVVGGRARIVDASTSFLRALRTGLPEAMQASYAAYDAEVAVAQLHHSDCGREQRRWFGTSPTKGVDLPAWDQRLLHYDRLASFLDHPFYPSARAKVGFESEDLARYAPEFAPQFELRWVAVPLGEVHGGEARPAWWPSFETVGLPDGLSASHALVPVHPFLGREGVEARMEDDSLKARLQWAPKSAVAVTPTLSVRTVAILKSPEWHLKLPLTIRTLGGRNLRTIKPSTLADGHRIQGLLEAIVAQEPSLSGRVLFTEEAPGAHVSHLPYLGFLARRYPSQALKRATVAPVAALLAPTPQGACVAEDLAGLAFDGDLSAFWEAYVELTLRFHFTLWLRFGIALEANQQNTLVVLEPGRPEIRLLLKDNDAGRIHRGRLAARWPSLDARLGPLEDPRIAVEEPGALSRMFITIALQLGLAAPLEGLAPRLGATPSELYARLRDRIEAILVDLETQGEAVAEARTALLEVERLPVKYLLTAASLLDKTHTGASDVNKFYGETGPNFLRLP